MFYPMQILTQKEKVAYASSFYLMISTLKYLGGRVLIRDLFKNVSKKNH